MKILFIVPYAPTAIRTRPLNLIKALASGGHRITLATLCGNEEELAAVRALNGILEDCIVEKIPAARTLWNCFRALPGRTPIQAFYSWNPAFAKKISEAAQTKGFDVIHVEHLRGAKYALLLNGMERRKDGKQPPLVWDSVDCISDLFSRAARHSCTFRARLAARFELGRTRFYEGWLANQFQRILVTSESDRTGLLSLANRQTGRFAPESKNSIRERITVVPNGVDLDYFSPSREDREPQTLVITGKMSYHANVTAVVRFVEETMPNIWAEHPRTRLWIVGRDPSPEIRKLGASSSAAETGGIGGAETAGPRIHVTGTVEDIRPYLRKATIAVAPIRYGAGIQNKVLEAMACGTPVVATREALGDIQAHPGRDLLAAGKERDLMQSILILLKNPGLRSSIGRAGRNFVEMNHDWQNIARGLTGIYKAARD